MRSRGRIVLTLSALTLVLLTGCASGTPTPVPTPMGTVPPFVDVPDDGTTAMPGDAVTRLELDSDTIRYQGVWHLRQVFLAQKTTSTDPCVVVGTVADDDDFQMACGVDAFAVSLSTYGTFRYSPAGFPSGTNGATAIGTWVTAIGGSDPTPPPTEPAP